MTSTRSGEVQKALRDLARAHRILSSEGHNDMSLGHMSVRDPHGRGLWLKRGDIGLEEVFEEDFILISFTGDIQEGSGVRHLEWPIHAEILLARSEVNVVAHTHPHHATLLSATEETIRPYTNEGVWFESNVPHYKGTSNLINTKELGRSLAEALHDADAVLMRNHGVTFVGESIPEATLAGIFLEKAARAQIILATTGWDHSYPDEAEIKQKHKTIYPPRAINNFWNYYNSKLDRLEGKKP